VTLSVNQNVSQESMVSSDEWLKNNLERLAPAHENLHAAKNWRHIIKLMLFRRLVIGYFIEM